MTSSSARPLSAASSSASSGYGPDRLHEDYIGQGALRQRWLTNNPRPLDDPCSIPRCQPTLEDIQNVGWQMRNNLSWTGRNAQMAFREWRDDVHEGALGIGLSRADPGMIDAVYRESFLELNTAEDHGYWGGRIRQGMLFLHDLKSGELATTARMSVVSHAVYATDFAIDTLRYVYVHNIVNKDTLEYIQHYLYSEANGLSWNDSYVYRTWEFGTPQYQGLLGTKCGKFISALLLGAFRPGTRRIARITTGGLRMLNARFDIEVINQ